MRHSKSSTMRNDALASLRAIAVAAAVVSGASAMAPSAAHALPVAADHACIGRWVGEGRNSNARTSWTIDLTLSAAPSGNRCGTIEYTNPTCGGTLEACTVVDGDIHTREAYSHNDGSCAPAGRVIIRCEGDRMRYSWIGWERVDSVLHRPAGYVPPPPRPPSPGVTPTPSPGVTPPTPVVPPPVVPGPSPTPSPRQTTPPRPPPGPPGHWFGGCTVVTQRAETPLWPWAAAAAALVAAIYARRRRREAPPR